MDGIETFGSHLLADVEINSDGTLKQSGKQNVRFYNKKRLSFKARPLWVRDDEGNILIDSRGKQVQAKDEKGKPLFEIDPKTGIPFKDAFEEIVEMIRVETRGDTNIKDDIADHYAKRQFHRQYKYFRDGKIPDGHSIEDFEFLQPGTIMELHMFGIHTLEQVADMDEVACEQIKDQSGFEIRDIARQWLRINSPDGKSAKADRMELENARLKREVESLKSQGKRPRLVDAPSFPVEEEEPAEEIATMELSPEQLKRGPGRPRKV
jgi:hypothetical protein